MKNTYFIAGLIFVGAISVILTGNNMETINRYMFKCVKPSRLIRFNDTFYELSTRPFFEKKRFFKDKSIEEDLDFDQMKIANEIYCINYIHKTSLVYHYGLKFINDKARQYILDKDIIHIGPHAGEAVYVLSNYTNEKIICINNCYSNVENFNNFVLENKLCRIPYIYEKINLDGENCTVNFSTVGISGEIKYHASKLDEYVSKFDSKIGAIVVSGSVLEHPLFPLHLSSNNRHEDPLINLLRGSLETIKKHRPILSMPYYYSGEFVETIEKFVTENLPDYKFIRCWKMRTSIFDLPFGEFVLIGYPGELSKG